ncbi:MAG: CotH kinase family protein [Bacteroidaceae bacterium]|nr:CotH kinase family protein [Bacteroidaceae bacterium]
MKKNIAVTLLFFLALTGWMPVFADGTYYVHMLEGGVYAYPESLLANEPQTEADGTLQLTLFDGQKIQYSADAYTSCTSTQPELPFFTSFKFNNKYNLHLHQDVEVADSLLVSGTSKTFTLVLNAIGKRLTPSFKTSDKSAVVFANGMQLTSKETRLRFDHDITFTVSYPQYVILAGVDDGHLIWEPFGNDYIVHTVWLTDNPNNVPRIDIHIDNGQTVKDKVTYLHANFHLSGNGVYEDLQEEVWIRGRGNDSWNWPKKPYRLKFDTKVKPFGLKGGKSWVLLSNYYRYSMLANPVAMKIAQLIGAPYPNHIIPVELYINDVYQGSYQFTEKVGFGANSIDGDEQNGYLLEFDTYYDEPYRFRSTPYDLPVNIKEPDLTEWEAEAREERFNKIKEETNALMNAISRKSDLVSTMLNIPSFARFLFAYEYTNNLEIYQPKSVFAYKEDITVPNGQLIYGPLWDFDWAYGGGGNRTSYWINPTEYAVPNWGNKGAVQFRNDMKSMGVVQYHYYKIWSDFMHNGSLDELCEYVQDFYDFARVSFEHNATKWDDGKGYDKEIAKIERWLRTRADYLFDQQPVYDISNYDNLVEGDVNGDGRVTVTDAFLVFSYLMGDELDDFDESRADINYDQKTNIADVTCIVRRALMASYTDVNDSYFATPLSAAKLEAGSFETAIGESVDIPVGLSSTEDAYCTLQLDVAIPDGLVLDSVIMGEKSDVFTVTNHAIGNNCTRIILMPQTSGVSLPAHLVTLRVRSIKTTAVTERTLELWDGHMTTNKGEEHRLRNLTIAFEQTTGLKAAAASSLHVTGGKQITITALEEQNVTITSIDGRKVQTVHVQPGENSYNMPSGIYIVAGKKIVVL